MKNKAVFSVFEIALTVLLLGIVTSYVYFDSSVEFQSSSARLELESFLPLLVENENYRSAILLEDLSSSSTTEDWSSIEMFLDTSFLSTGIIVSNFSTQKTISSCSSTQRVLVSSILLFSNTSLDSSRYLEVRVCY